MGICYLFRVRWQGVIVRVEECRKLYSNSNGVPWAAWGDMVLRGITGKNVTVQIEDSCLLMWVLE